MWLSEDKAFIYDGEAQIGSEKSKTRFLFCFIAREHAC